MWSDGTFPAAIKGVYRKVIQTEEEAFFFFSLWQSSLFHETPLKIYLVSSCSIKWESIYYLHLTVRSWQKQKIKLCLYRYIFLSDCILDISICEGLASASCPVTVLSKMKRWSKRGKGTGERGRGKGQGQGKGQRDREQGQGKGDRGKGKGKGSHLRKTGVLIHLLSSSQSLAVCFMRMLDMAKNPLLSLVPWSSDKCKDWPRRI